MTADNHPEPSAKYRLQLTSARWVKWYSETQVLTEAQAQQWIKETLAEPIGCYLVQAERYDPERDNWKVY